MTAYKDIFNSLCVLNLTDIFAALSDPTRLRILLLVAGTELAVGELADVLDQSQPRVSRHVRILAEAGLVERHKEGAWVFVRLARNPLLDGLLPWVGEMGEQENLLTTERDRLQGVLEERQRIVGEWFEENADEWDHLEQLGGSEEGLDAALLIAARTPAVGRLLDIGTGTGRMLELLAPHADYAVGIDRSPAMLRIARGKLEDVPNCEVRQADMTALPFERGSFDTIVFHQVLHFADDPQRVIRTAADLLGEDGKLLITDYEAHDMEELRTRYRHVRLGFEDDTIRGWLGKAKLAPSLVASANGSRLTVNVWEGRR